MKMKKYVLSICLIATFLLLASGWSFAAPVLNGGNITLAAEKIPVAPPGWTAGSGTPSHGVYVAYSGATLGANGQLLITLSGGQFTNATPTVDVCDLTTGVAMGATQAPGGQSITSLVYVLNQPLSPGTSYTIQPAGTCPTHYIAPEGAIPGYFAPTALTDIVVPAGSPAGTAVTMTIADNVSPGDANVLATGTVVTVMNQFSATLTPATSTLSFSTTPVLTGFTASGTSRTIPWTDANDSWAGLTILSNQNINDLVTVTADGSFCEGELTDADSFVLTVTGNLAGIGYIGYNDNDFETPDPGITAAQVTAGSTSLTVPGTGIQICYTGGANPASPLIPYTVSLVVPSTPAVAIGAGTYNLEVTLKGGNGAGDVASGYSRDLLTPVAQLEWTIQNPSNTYYIENILVGNGNETYIKFQSNATQTGLNGVSVAVLPANAACMATMPAYTTSIVPGTPLTILGSQLSAWATAQGCPVSSAGFAAIVKVNAPNTAIFQYASVCNAEGCKTIPVEVLYTTSTSSGGRGYGGMTSDYGHGGGGSGSLTISPSSPILY
jgi:hypothetical protein